MTKRKPLKDRFKEKVSIVTGGASGIGCATVEDLCKEGAAVAYTGSSDIGCSAERFLTDQGHNVLFCRGDIAEEEFCRSLVDQTVTRCGKTNYLINNAFSFTAKALYATREGWERVMQVGPMAYALMAQIVVPWMRQGGGGTAHE